MISSIKQADKELSTLNTSQLDINTDHQGGQVELISE